MNFIEYADIDMLVIDLAKSLAEALGDALHHQDRVLFAVAGGTSPGPVFDALSMVDIDWARVDVMPTDERWVPEDHARSNARLIKQRLLVNRAAAARFLPLYAVAHTPEEILADLEARIAPDLPIDVSLMGMGADMHTASMFPEADGLEAALDPHAPILVPIRLAALPDIRMTLSARVLDAAVSKHLLITGAEKRKALENARHLPPQEAPINSILTDLTVHWTK